MVVPGEKVLSRAVCNFLRQLDFAALQREVLFAIVEVALEPPADLDAVFGRNGEVASVEERVRVAAQE